MPARIFPWYTQEDYPALKGLFPDDVEFLRTFDDWVDCAQQQAKQYEERSGNQVNRVLVKSDRFIRYCEAAGIGHSTYSLSAYAIAIAAGHKDSR